MSERDRATDADTVQSAVAAARRDVLGGRGPNAGPAEILRSQRERPNLGGLPAPLERELVHIAALLLREVDAAPDFSTVPSKIERLRALWDPVPADKRHAAAWPWHPVNHDPASPPTPGPGNN
ncbi:hypothetical protein AB4305_22135 [Nocardia sp. 2YAB30]|uniref:hypothetical protein n=1 Tax=unclassified Nocardia TaxID=2637762 RepID=UPI003F98C1DD